MDGPGWRDGSRFGPYELRSLLGRGGMGEVYEAYDTVKDRVVAVKLLPEEYAKDPVYQVRFRRESQAAARLDEPHIIPIHDWGVIDGVLFIDMRLVSGVDLREILRGQGPMSPERALGVIDQIASALDAAHAAGLVHRDVKPANILVGESDFAYLADFGLAHSEGDSSVTQVGMAVGSYIYMAPERFDVGNVSGSADIYSLTCVLHECLTGASPFASASMNVLIRAHMTEPPPRPSTVRAGLPPALDAVIARGMAKDPGERYPTAVALAQAARAALTGPIPVAPTFVVRTPDPARFGQQSEPAPLSSLVPPEPTGEFSIIPTAATAVPTELQFEPLPSRQPKDTAPPVAAQANEPPVPIRPFPDAHLYEQGQQGYTPEPAQYPAPQTQRYGPVPSVSEPAVAMPQQRLPEFPSPDDGFAPPTEQYERAVPTPAAYAPASGAFPAGPGSAEEYSPATRAYGGSTPASGSFAVPETQRYDRAVPDAYSPAAAAFGESAPSSGSFAAPETRRYDGAVPDAYDPAVPAPGSNSFAAPETQRYDGAGSDGYGPEVRSYGDSAPGSGSFAAPETQRYDGAAQAYGSDARSYGDQAPSSGGFAAETRRYDGGNPEQYGHGAPPYGESAARQGSFAPEIQHYDGFGEDPYSPPTQQFRDPGVLSQAAEETRQYGIDAPQAYAQSAAHDAFADPAEAYGAAYDPDPHVATTQHYDGARQQAPNDPRYPEPDAYPAAQAYSDYQPDSPGYPHGTGGFYARDVADPQAAYGYAGQDESAYGAQGGAAQGYAHGNDGYGAPGEYDDYYGNGYHEPERRRSIVLPMLVAGVVIVVLAVGGVIGWTMFASKDKSADIVDQAGSITTSAVSRGTTPGAAAAPSASSTTSAAATSTALPAGAKSCSTGRAVPGSFAQTATGSEVTSCPFAEAVRQAYAESAAATSSRAPRSIVAVSPVTGRSYTMNCVASGQLVTCTGGENAVVYIY
ncbi:protein kinase domain-containing protein [Nocardia aurea]|uniref:serine/threonine-protein kinase n=1 Tax=Nocardia aurea TaxID=2144174 RepID=UPI003F4C542C